MPAPVSKPTLPAEDQGPNRAYVNRRDAAAYMCVSEKFLASHLHDGPKRILVGSRVVYRLSDLDDWMTQREARR